MENARDTLHRKPPTTANAGLEVEGFLPLTGGVLQDTPQSGGAEIISANTLPDSACLGLSLKYETDNILNSKAVQRNFGKQTVAHTGGVGTIQGLQAYTVTTHPSGTVGMVNGINATAELSADGDVTEVRASDFRAIVTGDGDATRADAVNARVLHSGAGTVSRTRNFIGAGMNGLGSEQLGLELGDIQNAGSGADFSWAIKTGLGLVQFGDMTVVAASTTARSSLRVPAGTAPTAPADGDIWYDGTHFYGRAAGVTKQLDN